MPILDPLVNDYLEQLATLEHPVLAEMEAEAASRSFPIVGPQVGRLLHLLARLCGARRVLELGSGFGYSAFWFARAVGRCTPDEPAAASRRALRAGMAARPRRGLRGTPAELGQVGWHKLHVHSAADPSALAALLVGCIAPLCALLPPCQRGASATSMLTS